MKKIGIVNYGCGNLFSLKSSFKAIGADAEVYGDEKSLALCDKIVLPGVGAFGDAANKLKQKGLDKIVTRQALRVPILGICLGMQLLFDNSLEYGNHDGLGLISGTVEPLDGYIASGLKIPHMGWNSLEFNNECPLFKYIHNGNYVYFVHSYFADTADKNVAAYTDYGGRITAAVQKDNVFGMQFHPEKSGKTGLAILKAFAELDI